jgi:DNA primase large subunit
MKKVKIEVIKNKYDKIYFYDELQIESLDYYKFQEYSKKRITLHRTIESNTGTVDCIFYDDQNEDINQHFCFRLVCAQTFWSSQQFVKQEVRIFEKRMQRCSFIIIKKFFLDEIVNKLTNLGIDYSNKEIKVNYNTIFDPNYDNDLCNVKDWKISFYFTHIVDLLQNRDVDVNKGFVKYNENVLMTFILNTFRKFLALKIHNLFQKCKYDQDERLLKVYENIFAQENQPNELNSSLKEDEKFFPPCITGVIKRLKTVGHLKYKDRLTLARFFKDSGMKVDDCVYFFKSNFRLNQNNFDKEYLYSIRHTYGLEGKRANYHAFTCSQVMEKISDNITFGCPFSNNKSYVKEYTAKHMISESDLFDIEELMKRSSCREACTATLGCIIKEKIPEKETITTPINFFKKFREKMKSKEIHNENK